MVPRRTHRGFTLLELMIAMVLGIMLLYAALAGFRVASQTITGANRLALENSLLRAGFQVALDELDTWAAYDDPDSKLAADQALRRPQMPFTPLPVTPRIQASATYEGTYIDLGAETDVGWDAGYPWPASAPRTWFRANPAEWHNSIWRNGDYTVFGGIGVSTHPWLAGQMDMLHTSLGWYGLVEYLPPSALYAYIAADPRQGKRVDLLQDFVSPGSFRNGDGGSEFPQGRYRCTKDTSYVLVPLKPVGGAGQVTAGNFRSIINTGVGASESSITTLMNRSLSSRKLLEQRPAHWPDVRVEVARFITYNRFVTLSRIAWTNTLTGQQIDLSFTGIGTTLRGARQQRRPGGPGSGAGWARWYAPRPGSSKQNDPTLDSQTQ